MSKWNAGNHDWLANNKKAVAFEVKSVNRVAVWQGVSQPVLVVRCDAGKIQAFIYTASAIQMEPQDENHSVGIRFDDQPESSERWADSSEHDALFAPGRRRICRESRQLEQAPIRLQAPQRQSRRRGVSHERPDAGDGTGRKAMRPEEVTEDC